MGQWCRTDSFPETKIVMSGRGVVHPGLPRFAFSLAELGTIDLRITAFLMFVIDQSFLT